MASAQTTEAAHYAMSQKNATKAYYASLLQNPNVQRGLAVIRATEGTAKKNNPYSTAFGGGTIKDLSKHPETRHSFTQKNGKKNTTTAAGAYQFLSKTWKSVANKLGLTDFGKMSQDVAALALIDGRNGLESLIAGDLVGFVNAVGPEWASLPTAPDAYSQPKVGWNKVKQAWQNYKPGDEIDPTSPEAIAAAYNSPSRGFDVIGGLSAPPAADQKLANAQIAYGASRALNQQPLSMSPPNLGALRGLNVPSAFSRPSAPPSNFSVPERPSPIGSAPLGQVTRAPLGPALARPSPPPSNFAKGTMPATPKENRIGGMDYAVAPERFGPAPVNAVRPSLAPSGLPAARMQSTVASRPATPAPTGLPAARQQTTVATRPNTPAPTGLPAAPSQASVMGALSQRAGLEAIKDASLAGPVPAPAINPAIANLPSRPISQVVPPVAMPPVAMPTVLAPPPAVYQPRPVSQVAPIAMRPTPPATAYDVYSGLANSAMDNTGRNRVDSLPGGVTSVTNQYGAVTGMTPGGYQTAVGSMPSIPGMSMPSKSTVGGALKGGLVGAGVAGPVGGVIGALAGALAAKAIADRKGTTAATPGQPSGGLGGLFGGLFGGRTSAPAGSSSKSSGSTSSRSGSGSYGRSNSGVYGSNPNSNSLRI